MLSKLFLFPEILLIDLSSYSEVFGALLTIIGFLSGEAFFLPYAGETEHRSLSQFDRNQLWVLINKKICNNFLLIRMNRTDILNTNELNRPLRHWH